MILDQRERKLFVGDADGRLFTVNIKNGAKMKKFQRHSKMITDIAHWNQNETRRIISASRESEVHIHDEDSQDSHKNSCRYNMKYPFESIA